ncbi:MAG: HAD family phosphatase [Veillonella sp.]|uniref:Cof-type HAD-IIB family hydrolase n=1 Tax=Veillonella sp. TaxID=1926307 RepID=UPI0025FC68A6|nr:Cof-type HAD-IIB family hydrolase [Veillonella sp.]MBS4913609.1 HAD family phosphatase [Veillonella sp.]
MNKEIKLLAIDLDDTLLRDDNTVSAYTMGVLKEAQKRGFHIVIATGRMYQTAVPVGRKLELGDLPMILFSGGLIQRIESGEIVWERVIEPKIATEILQLAKENNWYVQSYVDDVLLIHHDTDASRHYEKTTGAKAVAVGDELYTVTKGPNKLLFIGEPERLELIGHTLHEMYGDKLEIVRSKVNFLEINSTNSTKGNALHTMAEELGITADNVVAFGNSENDVSMLKYAGTAIAVANAEDPIKEIADEVCESNENDGVAKWIETNLFK